MKGSIVSIVKGGLGNQLFIYAASRAMALRLGRHLFLDTVLGYQNDTFGRLYRLNRLPINASELPATSRIAPSLKHPKHKIIRNISRFWPRTSRRYFAEQWDVDASQLTSLVPKKDQIFLLGYWQDEAYFEDSADVIRKELALPVPSNLGIQELGRQYQSQESIFIHFRRIAYNKVLSLDYYQSAIEAICQRVADPKFVLFGDSIKEPHEKLNFPKGSVVIHSYDSEDEFTDLWLMTQCRHAIIANSSYSWWAAWLREAGDSGIVYAPSEMGTSLCAAKGWKTLPNQFTN